MRDAKPSQSNPPCFSSRDSCRYAHAPATHAAPIGRLTKKIQRQPAHSVSAPPTSGPIATAAPIVAPQIPKAVPRSRPWNSWVRMASETENMIAPPTPWSAAGEVQEERAGGGAAEGGGDRENHDPGEEDPLAAEQVAERCRRSECTLASMRA